MSFGQTATRHRLLPLTIRHPKSADAFDTSSAEFDAPTASSMPSGLAIDGAKPRIARPIATGKAIKQLRILSARTQRKPAKTLGKPGHDHDTLSDNGSVDYAEEATSNNVPTVRGPFDPPLSVAEVDSTKRTDSPHEQEEPRE